MLLPISLPTSTIDSPRVRDVARMFDVPLAERATDTLAVELPDPGERWRIGLIVGPSGSGKTTVARTAFPTSLSPRAAWPLDRAVIDGFGERPAAHITRVLSAVGFSSPPAWVRPYATLSEGEKFRCDLARALLSAQDLVVFDEFTSVVDRVVARTCSAALSRAVRRGWIATDPVASGAIRRTSSRLRFVAVTCHDDVIPWLTPDWVLRMPEGTLSWPSQRPPRFRLRVTRADVTMWKRFQRHHYLSAAIHRSARCYVGHLDGRPAAFTCVLPFPHPLRPGWREHRTVCLPDYQGLGLGNAMSEFVAAMYVATGRPYFSTTGHPAMISHRMRSPLWRMTRKPGHVHAGGATSTTPYLQRRISVARVTAGFEYIGRPKVKDAMRLGVLRGGTAHQSV